ncbi:MAG: hypothetical protein WCE21_04740 [Candidatus Babeliales bacterium]
MHIYIVRFFLVLIYISSNIQADVATDRLERPLKKIGTILIDNLATEAMRGEYWLPGITQCTKPEGVYYVNYGADTGGFKCMNFYIDANHQFSFDVYQDERTKDTGQLTVRANNGWYIQRIINPEPGRLQIRIMNDRMYLYQPEEYRRKRR